MKGLLSLLAAGAAVLVPGSAGAEQPAIVVSSGDALVALHAGSAAPVPNGDGGSWPSWSPDGRRLAFTSVRRGGIWIVNADGSGLRRVTASPTIDVQPSWSPDGRRLAFARVVPGFETDIFVVGSDGRGLRRLTFNRGQDSEPDWAPNGRRIAWSFASTRTGGRSGIYTMSPSGAGKRFRGPGGAPAWSPDGRRFVFALDGDLWVSAVDGTQRRPLSVAPGVDARPEWSRDGSYVVFVSTEASPTDTFRLWQVAASGAGRQLLTPSREVTSFSVGR